MDYQLFLGRSKDKTYWGICPSLNTRAVNKGTLDEVVAEVIIQANHYLKTYEGIPSRMPYDQAKEIAIGECNISMESSAVLFYDIPTKTVIPSENIGNADGNIFTAIPGDCGDCPEEDA